MEQQSYFIVALILYIFQGDKHMYNNQTQNNYPVVPYNNNRASQGSQLPVLNPKNDTEEFDRIIPANELNSHWYFLASTRSGKSEFIKLVYIKLALASGSSIVLLDPHGDLARQCAKMMNDKKDIIYIDPTLKKGYTPTINPFRLKKRDEATIAIVAQELIIAFESIIGTEFSTNMEVLLTPLIYTLLRKGDSGIDELIRFLDDDNNEDLVAYALKSPIGVHVYFMRTQFKKGKFAKTKDALATKLQSFVNHPIFSNFAIGKSTVNLEKAINSNKIIIIRLPKGKMRKVLEPAAKLIMASIQGIVFKRSDLPETLRPKTHLICDEYQNFFSQMSDEILSESAKNNLFILGAHQYLSQLDGKSKDALMSGANIKIIGKNSNKDLKAMAEEIEVDIQSLKSLKQGEFFVKVGSNPAVKIITTDKFLGNNGSIDEILWKQILKYQRKKYYKKIEVATAIDAQIEAIVDNSNLGTSLPIPNFDEE